MLVKMKRNSLTSFFPLLDFVDTQSYPNKNRAKPQTRVHMEKSNTRLVIVGTAAIAGAGLVYYLTMNSSSLSLSPEDQAIADKER